MRPKTRLAEKMAIYFAEKGTLVSPKEFNRDKNRPLHVTAGLVTRTFGSWSRLHAVIKKTYPDLWELSQGNKLPSEETTTAETVSKPDPLATLRASTTEK